MLKEYINSFTDSKYSQISDYNVLRIAHVDAARNARFGPTLQSYHIITLVKEGRLLLHNNEQTQELTAGDIFILPAGRICYAGPEDEEQCSFYWIDFSGTRADQVMAQLTFASKDTLVFHNLPADDYEEVFKKGVNLDSTSNSSFFLATGVLMELLGLLARDIFFGADGIQKMPESLVYKIRQYIDMKYSTKLSVKDIALKYNIHPNYMIRIFRQAFGVTPKQYIQSLKLNKACELLIQTDLPISLISMSISFEDQLAFSKLFHKVYGVSPTEYRSEHRQSIAAGDQ